MSHLQQLVNGLATGSVYALFAVGFTLTFGTLRLLNLAHGAIFMVGSFAGLVVLNVVGLPFPVALLAAGIAGSLASVVVEQVAFRPLRSRSDVSLPGGSTAFSTIITSFGASAVLQSLFQQLSGTRVLTFDRELLPTQLVTVGGLRVSVLQLIAIAALVVVSLAMYQLLERSNLGRQVRAVADNPHAAGLVGISPVRMHALVFAVSGFVAGIAGALVGALFNQVHFLMGQPYLLIGAVVITVGGLGSVVGAVVAALALGVIQSFVIAAGNSSLSDIITYGILFLFLVLRPNGLLGGLSGLRTAVRA